MVVPTKGVLSKRPYIRQLQTKFLCNGEPSSTSASHLYDFVNEQINKHELDSRKLVGFGCDGAANRVFRNLKLDIHF
jgi:hypothetical protein